MKNPVEKLTNREYLLDIDVKPNSNQQDIHFDQEFLIISLQSAARKNKANKELFKLLKKKLKVSTSQLQLISGQKSRSKRVKIVFNEEIREETILDRLLS